MEMGVCKEKPGNAHKMEVATVIWLPNKILKNEVLNRIPLCNDMIISERPHSKKIYNVYLKVTVKINNCYKCTEIMQTILSYRKTSILQVRLEVKIQMRP